MREGNGVLGHEYPALMEGTFRAQAVHAGYSWPQSGKSPNFAIQNNGRVTTDYEGKRSLKLCLQLKRPQGVLACAPVHKGERNDSGAGMNATDDGVH